MTWVKDSLLWVVHGHLPIFKISHKNSASVAQVLSHVAIKKLLQTKEQPACTLGLGWNKFWRHFDLYPTVFSRYINSTFMLGDHNVVSFCRWEIPKKVLLSGDKGFHTYFNLRWLEKICKRYLNSVMSLWVNTNLAHLAQNFFALKKPSWGLNFFTFFLLK